MICKFLFANEVNVRKTLLSYKTPVSVYWASSLSITNLTFYTSASWLAKYSGLKIEALVKAKIRNLLYSELRRVDWSTVVRSGSPPYFPESVSATKTADFQQLFNASSKSRPWDEGPSFSLPSSKSRPWDEGPIDICTFKGEIIGLRSRCPWVMEHALRPHSHVSCHWKLIKCRVTCLQLWNTLNHSTKSK